MGAGKTTTAAKIAGALVHSRSVPVGLISTDVERPGGSALLTAFAQELQISITSAGTASDLQNRLSRWNCRGPLVIDTRGHSPRDSFGIESLGNLLDTVQMKKHTYLVMSATEHPAVARECLNAFGQFRLTGVILTRVDQAAGIGHCLEEVRKTRLPVAFIGTGERVPQDLHIPRPESLAALENASRAALV
jgi:flagellar biosynthesis protein FlhF